jgi:putative ABC transport system permease protein
LKRPEDKPTDSGSTLSKGEPPSEHGMLFSIAQDLRVAVRVLRQRPAFATTALLTLALGIGANTAVFSVVHGIVLAPLPYAAPNRLVGLWPGHFFSNAEMLFLQERSRSLERVELFSPGWSMALTGEGEPAQLIGARTSAGLFDALGVRPVVGRTFTAEDARPAASGVAMLSHELWRTRFGGDPRIVGHRIMLDGVPCTVVGVMPADFRFHRNDVEVWTPLAIDPAAWFHRGGTSVGIARLAPGATPATALAELRTFIAPMRDAFQYTADYGQDVNVVTLQEMLVGDVRLTLLVLFGAVGFIVLIAAANVGNLLLVRAAERRREIAVRVALGAASGRIVQQFLVESLVLSVLGGALGLGLGWIGVSALRRLLPLDTPRLGEVTVDLTVLALCAAVAVATGLLFGLAPALLAARTQPQGAMRSRTGDGTGGAGAHIRGSLVAAEVGLAFVLVVGAGLMLRTLWNLSRVDPGFRSENVLTFSLQKSGGAATRQRYYVDVTDRIRRVPGVRDVGAIHHLPLSGFSWYSDLEVEGRTLPPGTSPPRAGWRLILGDYFRAMSIPLLAGRSFDARDDSASTPVAIVSQSLASRLWPGESPLGKRFTAGNATLRRPVTIVGVAGDVRHEALTGEPAIELYRPATQQRAGAMQFTVRTTGDALAASATVRDAVRSIDPNVPVANMRLLDAVVSQSVAGRRVVMSLLLAFALVGVALGTVGVFGVVAFAVSQRTHEIGLRIALGAGSASISRMVVWSGARYAVVGLVAGLLAALGLSRVMRGLVFGVGATDPLTYLTLAVLLLVVVVLASLIPARRATRVHPMTVLRAD